MLWERSIRAARRADGDIVRDVRVEVMRRGKLGWDVRVGGAIFGWGRVRVGSWIGLFFLEGFRKENIQFLDSLIGER